MKIKPLSSNVVIRRGQPIYAENPSQQNPLIPQGYHAHTFNGREVTAWFGEVIELGDGKDPDYSHKFKVKKGTKVIIPVFGTSIPMSPDVFVIINESQILAIVHD